MSPKVSTKSHPLGTSTKSRPLWKIVSTKCHCPRNVSIPANLDFMKWFCKLHIFWEGHKILRNLHRRYDWHYTGQIYGGDLAKFCGLLRMYELYEIAKEISCQTKEWHKGLSENRQNLVLWLQLSWLCEFKIFTPTDLIRCKCGCCWHTMKSKSFWSR